MGKLRQATVPAAVVAVLLAGSGCALVGGPAEPQTVYIGVDLPLSGQTAAVGVVHHDALRLRVEQVNQDRLAGEGFRLGLRVLDNRGDPEVAAANLAELAADPQVAAVVAAGCPQCLSEGEPPPVPVVSLDPVDGPPADAGLVFWLGPSAVDNADRLAQRMAADGVRTVGLVYADDLYGRAGARLIGDAQRRDGLELVVSQPVAAADATGVNAAAEAVAAWRPQPDPAGVQPPVDPEAEAAVGPDAVVIWAPAPQAAQAAAGLRKAGYDGPLYVDMVGVYDLFLSGDATAFAGATLVATETTVIDQVIGSSPAAAARFDWFNAYLSRYGTYHIHASWAADAVTVLAGAIARAGGTEPEMLREKLQSTRVDGFTGLVRFTATEHSGLHPTSLVLLTAAGGRWYPHPSDQPPSP